MSTTVETYKERAIASGFTPAQAEILANFEDAAESQDLRAFGDERRSAAQKRVALWYNRVLTSCLGMALTHSEHGIGKSCRDLYPDAR